MMKFIDRTSFYIMMGGLLFGFVGAIKDIDPLFGLGLALELIAIVLLVVEINNERRNSKQGSRK